MKPYGPTLYVGCYLASCLYHCDLGTVAFKVYCNRGYYAYPILLIVYSMDIQQLLKTLCLFVNVACRWAVTYKKQLAQQDAHSYALVEGINPSICMPRCCHHIMMCYTDQ